MTASIWRIGQLLNSVQTSFVGLLQVWTIPLVLLLSLASGYTTYYGLSHFITPWIALVITVAVQSVIVICSLELASVHWSANAARFLTVVVTLLIALFVSVSFSYFKFYELSQQDTILLSRQQSLEIEISRYLDEVSRQKSELIAEQQRQTKQAAIEANQAFLGALPNMQGEQRNRVGRGRVWSHYNALLQGEQAKLKDMEAQFEALDTQMRETRTALQTFSMNLQNAAAYDQVIASVNAVRSEVDRLIVGRGGRSMPGPKLGSFAEFSQGITPSFAMWEDLSLFALACAAMVDFFTLVLSYRLEFTAPGPLTEEERDLAFRGISEFNEFLINRNDELQFVIEKSELERARRYSDWLRMFVVAFLLNRGFLRKVDERSVEFAPNLYPIISERLRARTAPGATETVNVPSRLAVVPETKRHG
jgi:hypothetical protein